MYREHLNQKWCHCPQDQRSEVTSWVCIYLIIKPAIKDTSITSSLTPRQSLETDQRDIQAGSDITTSRLDQKWHHNIGNSLSQFISKFLVYQITKIKVNKYILKLMWAISFFKEKIHSCFKKFILPCKQFLFLFSES